METKPEKIIYEKQEEIYEAILNFVKLILPKEVTEAYLWGSVIERKFGKYIKMYGSHEGSDIDIIVMIPEEKIPPCWKYLGVQKEWWYLYRGEKIEINGTMHKIELMIIKEGKEDYARNRIKEKNWNVEKIK